MPANKRLPTHRRVKNPPPMQLTDRDRQVIEIVHTYRFLRQDQIQALVFRSKWSAQYRLVRLYQHRYLNRLFTAVFFGRGRTIYCLDKRGAELLAEEPTISKADLRWNRKNHQVTSQFMEHSLAVNDVRIALELSCRELACQITEWIDEHDLKKAHTRDQELVHVEGARGIKQRVAVVPDGYFVLQAGNRRAHVFLEVDRATITNKRWMQRVRAYDAYYRSGRYETRYQTRSLRVLTVTTGEERLANLKKATEKAGGGMMYRFTTFNRVTAEDILTKPIWRIAGRRGTHRLVEKLGRRPAQNDSAEPNSKLTSHTKYGTIYCVNSCT